MKLETSLMESDEITSEDMNEPQEAVKAALNDELSDYYNSKKRRFKYLSLISVAALGIGFSSFFIPALPSTIPIGIGVIGITSAFVYVKLAEPSLKVNSVEKRYWSVHCIPQKDSNIYYDASSVMSEKSFDLKKLEGVEKLNESKEKLEQGLDLPVLRDNENNPEEELRKTVNSFEDVLTDTNSHRMKAPLIGKEDEVSKSINQMLKHKQIDREEKNAKESMQVDMVDAKKNVKVMNDLESLAFADNAEDELREVKSLSKKAADDLKQSKQESIEKLNSEIESIGEMVSIRSFNFYCPSCLKDDVYSELKWSKGQENWLCPTCEMEFGDEDNIIPKHKMKDELVEQIWDSLWTEKDDEKRRIYERIQDKKDDLQTDEFNKKREEINRVGDKIKEIKSNIRGLEAEAEAAEQTVEKLGRLMEKYDRIGKQRRKKFKQEVEKENKKIEKEVQKAIRQQQAEDEKMLKEAQKKAEKKAKMERIEEQKKHREELIMEAQSQKQEAEIAKAEMHQDKKHQREDYELDKKGKTSSTIIGKKISDFGRKAWGEK